jgi:Caspase domain
MCKFRTIVLLLISCWLGCGSAVAEKRVALLIGNSAYKNVGWLANPANDATMVAAMLRSAGFDSVTTKLDLGLAEMRKSLREFGAQTRDADVAIIFYAGHGIEMDGNNYLIPTDATLETDIDVFDETFPLDRILFTVEPAKQLRLIIVDACRDNPFAKKMKRTIAARAIGRGLAKVEPNSPNTMIAFAAKAGSTALDGDSNHSPFALALVEHLPKPGLDLRRAFGFVRDDVLKNTGYKQEPYVYGSLGGDDVPLVPARAVIAGPQPNPDDAIRRDYELALQLGTRGGWLAFLGRYPTGFYAELARGQLNKIAAVEAGAAAAEKSRLAEQERARLAAEGAKKAEQEKAAAEANAADEARVAAEKAKQIEIDKTAAAEWARAVAEEAAAQKQLAEHKAAEKLAAEKPALDKPAADLTAKQTGYKQGGENASNDKVDDAQKIVSLTPADETTSKRALSATELAKSLQLELRRIGCFGGTADGDWNLVSQRALEQYNRFARTTFDVKLAKTDALESIKSRTGRLCPLSCRRGFRALGDDCVKITCEKGFFLNEDNVCERYREKVVSKAPSPRASSRPQRKCFVVNGSNYCE